MLQVIAVYVCDKVFTCKFWGHFIQQCTFIIKDPGVSCTVRYTLIATILLESQILKQYFFSVFFCIAYFHAVNDIWFNLIYIIFKWPYQLGTYATKPSIFHTRKKNPFMVTKRVPAPKDLSLTLFLKSVSHLSMF